MKRLPNVVVWLGVVSLATDGATEMIYPLLPLFLTGVLGASLPFVGVIEGAAEATASLLKLLSGKWSDLSQRRKPLTVLGYGLSSLLRPLCGLATAPWMVLLVRLGDRLGKGLRSSPRDALLAEATPVEIRGRAFGFHRAMDSCGAVLGPLIATVLLHYHFSLRQVFLVAIVPGAVAMVSLVFKVKEPARQLMSVPLAASSESSPNTRSFRFFLGALAVFALGNSSDAFLLLRARQIGVRAESIPLLWLAHSAVKAVLSTAAGSLSDRLGRRSLIIAGWLIFAVTYLGFAVANRPWQMWALFVLYGFYYALVEGNEKALVTDLVAPAQRGHAFGRYYVVIGLTALPASIGFGILADRFGAAMPFTAGAVLALIAAVMLQSVIPHCTT